MIILHTFTDKALQKLLLVPCVMVSITVVRDLVDGKLTSSTVRRFKSCKEANITNDRLSEPYCWKCATWLYTNDKNDTKLCMCPVSTSYH